MRLTPRFTFAFIVYAVILLGTVGLLAYNSGKASLRLATASDLEGTALRKETNMNNWISSKEALISVLASDPAVLQAATTLMSATPGTAEFHTAHDQFVSSVEPRLETSQFLGVSLIDAQSGEVIASTAKDEEGQLKKDKPYFTNGKNGPYIENPYFSDALQAIAMTASTPVYGADRGLLGVLTARLDITGLSDVINRRTNVHQTDEAYLVNASNLFVTQPRFLTDSVVLRQEVHTEDVNHCLQQETGVIETADYRDVPAFVAYRWLPERQLCLVVKIDQSEAYAPIRLFGRNILLISILALLLAVGIAVELARTMTRPILALQNGVTRFAKGELDLRLDASSEDELGELAGEFNRMADALAEEQTHLRRRTEEFFNLTADLLCTVDSSGCLQDLNPAWEQTLGYKADELRGFLFTNLVHGDDLDMTTAALHRVTNTRAGRFEIRCHCKDGGYRWLAWVVVLSPQDQLLYATARDITERREGEEALRQQADELERSNRDLEQFAHVASHDLQEPLRVVTSNVQWLARRYQGKLDKDANEFIGGAIEATNRMKNLLADLFAYSRVSSRTKEFATVDLEESLKQVLDGLRPVIHKSNAIVTHDPLPPVMGDGMQMTQLFQSLIENAIKFHGMQRPRIHVGVRRLGERWLFYVQDNGIGIDPQYSDRLFALFQRLHSQEQYPGRGVGLAISRRIVERHGGRIWVDSEPTKGATFYFTLPPAESQTPEVMPQEVVKPRTKDTVVDRATDLI